MFEEPLWITLLVLVLNALMGFLMKQFLTEDRLDQWRSTVIKVGEGLGVAITVGASRIPGLKQLYNIIIEPVIILLFDTLWSALWIGIKTGLLSDQRSLKQQTTPEKRLMRQR